MGTLFLSCVCDSLLAKLCEKGCLSITEIHQAGTDCHDVCIVFIICVAVAFIALIAALTVFGLKCIEKKAKEKERKAQKEKEGEESKRKQKADMLDKYLDFLKNNASKKDNLIQNFEKVLSNFKTLLPNETKKCNFICCNITESDKNRIIDILEEQMKSLNNEDLKPDANAIAKYKQVLAYLIEKTQKEEMNQITQKELLCEQNEEQSPTQKSNED